MKQLALGIAGVKAKAVRELRTLERTHKSSVRRYPHIPYTYFRELNRLWTACVSKDIDYARAAKAWAKAWDEHVLAGEDPLRFSLDMVGCLVALADEKDRGVHWLQAMTPETVVKMLGRYRAGLFRDAVGQHLLDVLGDGNG